MRYNMALKGSKKIIGYEIKVLTNPGFCGIDAGGVQFSYGKARIKPGRMVEWFKEHDGYEVIEIPVEEIPVEEGNSPDTPEK